MKPLLKFVPLFLLCLSVAGNAAAKSKEVCYRPKVNKGKIETYTTGQSTNQGVVNSSWRQVGEITNLLPFTLDGTVAGVVSYDENSNPIIDYTIVPYERNGKILATGVFEEGSLVHILECFDPQGNLVPVDANGVPTIYDVTILANVTEGTGEFKNIKPNKSKFKATGRVNNCPFQDNYLHDDFILQRDGSILCFK